MPRPRMYQDAAEKNRAYRLRKKQRENQQPPQLDDVARKLHWLYKHRAATHGGYREQLIGKTPYETLLRVVVYELLFDRHLKDGDTFEFPPLDKLIIPLEDAAPAVPAWLVSPDELTMEAAAYVQPADSYEQAEPKPKRKRTKTLTKRKSTRISKESKKQKEQM